jgi:hypothetical protein
VEEKRATDGNRVLAIWGRFGRDLVTFVAVGLAAWAVHVAEGNSDKAATASENALNAVRQSEHEANERRDQTCTIFETKQKSDVDALAQTYRYLGDLTKAEMGTALNRAILAQLPRTIREAQTDDAPDYCDQTNPDGSDIGLPEPDPKLPTPPKNLPTG